MTMLVFAHTGIPVAVAWLSEKTAGHLRREVKTEEASLSTQASRTSKTGLASGRIDYRLLLIGSLLPDIVDKPLGTWILADSISNGRIYTHTLLFTLLLAGIGVYLWTKFNKTGVLVLSLGCATHLILDQMWRQPATLFWPLFGWDFPVNDLSEWWQSIFDVLFSEPEVYIPELFGIVILTFFFVDIIRRKNLLHFIRTGKSI